MNPEIIVVIAVLAISGAGITMRRATSHEASVTAPHAPSEIRANAYVLAVHSR